MVALWVTGNRPWRRAPIDEPTRALFWTGCSRLAKPFIEGFRVSDAAGTEGFTEIVIAHPAADDQHTLVS